MGVPSEAGSDRIPANPSLGDETVGGAVDDRACGTGVGPRGQPVTALTPRFADALVVAHALHSAQTRKGTDVPYVSHLLGTCAIALEHGANEDQAIAALL